jgi:hypothetical protein
MGFFCLIVGNKLIDDLIKKTSLKITNTGIFYNKI